MSSSLQQDKSIEAAAQLQQAEKALSKRSFFRNTPDYLVAASLFEKAGELYRLGGDFQASKNAFKQCATAQEHNQLLFRAAQAWENVARTVFQQYKVEQSHAVEYTREACQAYDKACELYVDMNEFGKAADALVKGAQLCETTGFTDTNVLALYYRACDLLETQDQPHFAIDAFRKTLTFLVKQGQYHDAIKLLDRMVVLYEAMEQWHNVHKVQLSQIILRLVVGDVSAADALYSRCLQDDSFLSSDDCALAEDLVRAFKMGNEDLLQTTVRKPGFMALDNHIGRLCRKLSVYGSGNADASSQPKRHQRTVPSRAGNIHSQKQSTRDHPPSERTTRAQRNPFAPSSKAAAQAQTSTLSSEYESSKTPTVSTSDTRDSDYEAALAEALGEVDVSKKNRWASKPTHFASPELGPMSSNMSPNLTSSPPPAALRASARTEDEFDDLEFTMPDSDAFEFSISGSTGTAGTSGYSDSCKAATTFAVNKKTPVSKRAPVASAHMDDEFDLT